MLWAQQNAQEKSGNQPDDKKRAVGASLFAVPNLIHVDWGQIEYSNKNRYAGKNDRPI